MFVLRLTNVASLPRRSRTVHGHSARRIGETIGIDWNKSKFDFAQFRAGLHVELDHGSHDPNTDVIHDDPVATDKIALAHLNELPDYHVRLEKMEEEAEAEHSVGREDGRAYLSQPRQASRRRPGHTGSGGGT